MKYFKPIYWVYVYLPILAIMGVSFIFYSKVKAEVVMCKTYYKEVSVWDCYWMPKTLPVRSSK